MVPTAIDSTAAELTAIDLQRKSVRAEPRTQHPQNSPYPKPAVRHAPETAERLKWNRPRPFHDTC